MSRKSRITAEEKIQIAQDCIEGRISQSEAARRVEVDESSVRAWSARYEAEGSLGFAKAEKNRVYSEEINPKRPGLGMKKAGRISENLFRKNVYRFHYFVVCGGGAGWKTGKNIFPKPSKDSKKGLVASSSVSVRQK